MATFRKATPAEAKAKIAQLSREYPVGCTIEVRRNRVLRETVTVTGYQDELGGVWSLTCKDVNGYDERVYLDSVEARVG